MLSDLIARIPRSDLHLHLDGSVRPSTIIELAREQGVTLPTTDEEELRAILMPGEDCESLEDYLKAFDVTCSVMGTRDALVRIAEELVEDVAGDNHKYVEVRYSTRVIPGHTLSPREMVEAVWEGLERGRKKHGVIARQILCGMRHEDPAHGIEVADLAIACRDIGVVAYDIAGAEAPFPPRLHVEAFKKAASEGLLRTTCHAGEAAGADFIREAITLAGSERIGHGTHLPEDPELMAYVADRQIPIEICLTSNIQTGAASSFESHPLRTFLDAGILCVLCTDNRTVSGVSVADEYERAVQYHKLSVDELRELCANGFRAAFLPLSEKQALVDAALREFDAARSELGL